MIKQSGLLLLILCTCQAISIGAAFGSQVLVRVGDTEISEAELSTAMASAPFATRFASLDEKKQANLRKGMLLRLVNTELLRQEAVASHIDSSAAYIKALEHYRANLLSRHYDRKLRESVKIPDAIELELKRRYPGNPDALAAERAFYIAKRYGQLKQQRFQQLREKYNVHIDESVLSADSSDDDVVAAGNFFKITRRDLRADKDGSGSPRSGSERERLDNMIDTALASRAAQDDGIDVDSDVTRYGNDLLQQLLLGRMEKQWIPDKSVLHEYYRTHPQLGLIPAREHVAQIVLADCDQASVMRQRIEDGESLFKLASEYSIDLQARNSSGDLGWLVQGSGYPALESAIQALKPGQLSAPVQTPKGCHLVQLLGRKPARQRAYVEVSGSVRQALLAERSSEYLKSLAAKYPVTWLSPVRDNPAAKTDE
jgi:hypothetical protein